MLRAGLEWKTWQIASERHTSALVSRTHFSHYHLLSGVTFDQNIANISM